MDKTGSINRNISINNANQTGQGQQTGNAQNAAAQTQAHAILQSPNGPQGAMHPADGLTAAIVTAATSKN